MQGSLSDESFGTPRSSCTSAGSPCTAEQRAHHLDRIYTDGRDLTDQQMADLDNHTRAMYATTRACVKVSSAEVTQALEDLCISQRSPSSSPRSGKGRLPSGDQLPGGDCSSGDGPPPQPDSSAVMTEVSEKMEGLSLLPDSDFPTPSDSEGWSLAKRPLRVPRLGLLTSGTLYLGTGAFPETVLDSNELDSRGRLNQLVPRSPRSASANRKRKNKMKTDANKFSSLS